MFLGDVSQVPKISKLRIGGVACCQVWPDATCGTLLGLGSMLFFVLFELLFHCFNILSCNTNLRNCFRFNYSKLVGMSVYKLLKPALWGWFFWLRLFQTTNCSEYYIPWSSVLCVIQVLHIFIYCFYLCFCQHFLLFSVFRRFRRFRRVERSARRIFDPKELTLTWPCI